MPADHGLGLHDCEVLRPSRPDTGEHNPERTIDRSEVRPFRIPTEEGELLPEREVLGDQARSRPEGRAERANDRREERHHVRTLSQRHGFVSRESVAVMDYAPNEIS